MTTDMFRLSYYKSRCFHYSWLTTIFVSGVWRYQMGNQNPYIEEEHTMQWVNGKGQVTIYKARVTSRVPLMEQERLKLPKNLSSYPVCNGFVFAQSLVLCVVFCRSLFIILSFYFSPLYIVCSSVCSFWLRLWYLQKFTYRLKLQTINYVFPRIFPI
jgi:hypothetical protein